MKDATVSKKRAKTVTPLTREEQAKVSEACLKHGSLVKTIAKEYLRDGSGHDLEDLVQIGYQGLVKAVLRWREDAGSSFVTIANLDIRDSLRIAVGGNWTKKRDLLRGAISVDDIVHPQDDFGHGESFKDSLPDLSLESQEEDVSRGKSLESLRAALNKASAKDRELLTLWLECHENFKSGSNEDKGGISEMARRLNVPRKTVGDRVHAAFKRMQASMEANEVNADEAPFVYQSAA